MSPFRTMMTGLLAASLATPAFAQCMQPTEKPGFDIRALQSQLMVLALTCSQTDEYNRFVTQNRAVLTGAYNDVQRHFRRVAGNAWQRQIDAYITNTANGHSQTGISQGSLFCSNQAQLFPQALAVTSREQLAQLSQQRQPAPGIINPTDQQIGKEQQVAETEKLGERWRCDDLRTRAQCHAKQRMIERCQ